MNYTTETSTTDDRRYSSPDKVNISFLGFLAFICGLPFLYKLNLMGELFATEIILPFFTIVLLFSNKEKQIFREKIFWLFILSTLTMIVGYVFSDLMAGTSEFNSVRAWGRNWILLSDIVCLSIVATIDKRYIWWYMFGAALGSITYLALTGVPFTNANWKLEYSNPTLLLVIVAGYLLPSFLIVWLTVAVGIFSFYMDGRSFGVTCMLLAGILWIRRGNAESLQISIRSLTKIFLAVTITASIIVLILTQTNEDYSDRRESSSLGRFAAIRIAAIAISDSPILGFGSWGEGTRKYAKMLYKDTQFQQRNLGQSNFQEGKIFLAHSQILQSWMEGGIFAAQLFIFYGYQILTTLKKIIFTRRLDYMTQLYSFLLLLSFWNLFMSPYSGSHRLGIAITIAIISAVNLENPRKISKIILASA